MLVPLIDIINLAVGIGILSWMIMYPVRTNENLNAVVERLIARSGNVELTPYLVKYHASIVEHDHRLNHLLRNLRTVVRYNKVGWTDMVDIGTYQVNGLGRHTYYLIEMECTLLIELNAHEFRAQNEHDIRLLLRMIPFRSLSAHARANSIATVFLRYLTAIADPRQTEDDFHAFIREVEALTEMDFADWDDMNRHGSQRRLRMG